MRYPGIDIPEAANPDRIGTRLRGPHWMNFLVEPWLYQTEVAMLHRPMAEPRRWERRFLD